MNERIDQLAEQCRSYWKSAGDMTYPQFDHRKFAELIVRECAEVGYDSVEDGDNIDDIMRRVHNNILKHFGVEE